MICSVQAAVTRKEAPPLYSYEYIPVAPAKTRYILLWYVHLEETPNSIVQERAIVLDNNNYCAVVSTIVRVLYRCWIDEQYQEGEMRELSYHQTYSYRVYRRCRCIIWYMY